MQLIADSGATKANWRLIQDNDKITNAATIGYSPQYLSSEKMEANMREVLLPQLDVPTSAINRVFFYGAGCSTPNSKAVVQRAIDAIFTSAEVVVDHDLLAAARSACGKQAGVACILGTGSNSCLYDGKDIIDNVPSMGFILGDEGAGASLGRRLIKAYFYRELPTDLKYELEASHNISKEEIFANVYQGELPSRYMAQFTKFMGQHMKHPFIYQMIKAEFTAFVQTQIMKYETAHEVPVSFVGSIAYYFQAPLKETLEEHDLIFGRIVQDPIEQLLAYHLE